MTSVQRRRFFTGSVDPLADDGVVIDFADPYVEPLPVPDFNVGRFSLLRGRKAYELSNHLGNVLAVVADYKVRGSVEIGTDSVGNPVEAALYEPFVWSMTDYYPFGMEMPERRYIAGDYRYGFNGQEGDDEHLGSGNSYAFRYRVHDARTGRFLSVDPLEGEYPWNSTYAFAENRVIDGIELEGYEWAYYKYKNGKTIVSVNTDLVVSEEVHATLSVKIIAEYAKAIQSQFDRTMGLSSNGEFSGVITFHGGESKEIGRSVPEIFVSGLPAENETYSPPSTTWNSIYINIFHGDGELKTPQEFALDFWHEMFHTLRFQHPFEVTQTEDTRLIRVGKNSYESVAETDDNIVLNIMMYNYKKVDGVEPYDLQQEGEKMEFLTRGQLELLKKEIDLQAQGEGIVEKPGSMDFYFYYPGTPVKSISIEPERSEK